MDDAKMTIGKTLANNAYPGRGLIVGADASGKYAVTAYFIMGRSQNSRNRVFKLENGVLFTYPYDPSKVKDPSLIIYNALKSVGDHLIITNGDQTDTIAQFLSGGGTFEDALQTREYEPDKPSYTPRISADLTFKNGSFSYKLAILKKDGDGCARYYFNYPKVDGVGRFISTYAHDGDPLPSFDGEPRQIVIEGDIDSFANEVWNALDEDNKVSLFVRYTELSTGLYNERIINKNK